MGLTLRSTKGTALTHTELDGNFQFLDGLLSTIDVDKTGVPDVEGEIQTALDAKGAAGGGLAFLPRGNYRADNVISVPDNVYFFGEPGTVIIGPSGARAGKTISGVQIYAAIAIVGVSNSTVSTIELDHATNQTNSNGFQVGESGATVRATDNAILNCRMNGSNQHSYLIYSKCADRTKILNNLVVGHSVAPTFDLVGIEVYGGNGVEVAGNNVSMCKIAINLQQETAQADSDLIDTNVHHNTLNDCEIGIKAISNDGLNHLRTLLSSNIIENMSVKGIDVAMSATGVLDGMIVDANMVVDAGLGIVFDAGGATPTAMDNIAVTSNMVKNAGAGKRSVRLRSAKNISFGDNIFAGTPEINLDTLDDTENIRSTSDVFKGATAQAVAMQGNTADVIFARHRVENYGTNAMTAQATCDEIRVFNGYFDRASGNTNNTVLNFASTPNCKVGDNRFGWDLTANPYDLSSTSLGDAGDNLSVSGTSPLHDLALPGAEFFRMTGNSGDFTITGLTGGEYGRKITLFNRNNFNCTLAQSDSGSTAGNRIHVGQAALGDLVLPPYASARLEYSTVDSHWVVVSTSI